MKSYIVVVFLGLAMLSVIHSASSASCPCPQCIIYDPICAYDRTLGRRGFSSGCHMLCYNRCNKTNYMKQSKGSKCI